MRLNKLRRSQLVAPFGPGALHILKQGMAVLTAGLDHWGETKDGRKPSTEQLERMIIREPRLQRRLGVDHFRVAPGPDTRMESDEPELITPLLRFPTWYVCPRCHRMHRDQLHRDGWVSCSGENCKNERMHQVRFAAVCQHGHLQDFPWLEWVHRSGAVGCQPRDLSYRAGGSGSLSDIVIRCKCGMQRSLDGIMQGGISQDEDDNDVSSRLTNELLKTEKGKDAPPFLCLGQSPWLGDDIHGDCAQPMRGILINATNVHYGNIKSAIRLPFDLGDRVLEEIRDTLGDPRYRSVVRTLDSIGDSTAEIVGRLRRKMGDEFPSHPEEKIARVVDEMRTIGEESPAVPREEDEEGPDGMFPYDEASVRREEYRVLQDEHGSEGKDVDLVVRKADMSRLPSQLNGLISDISLIEKLKETRAFAGFSRLLYERPRNAPDPQRMLWREWPRYRRDRWLPASIVQGEGMLITLDSDALSVWEREDSVQQQTQLLQNNFNSAAARYRWMPKVISSRLILIHSLAHALINQLVFECGYGSASLRERLYVEQGDDGEMSGFMIYTASGDSEGSMGGLVRMGEPDKLGEVLFKALNKVSWCGGDPICGEAVQHGGQGPDSLNLAACRSCLLLPETSCEEFNRFLDRSFLTGVLTDKTSGFFGGLIG